MTYVSPDCTVIDLSPGAALLLGSPQSTIEDIGYDDLP